MTTAVYWLGNDLRLEDNLSLHRAASTERQLSFVYCIDPQDLAPHNYHCKALGPFRKRFLLQALIDLDKQLNRFGQHINVFLASPYDTFKRLSEDHKLSRIYYSETAGWNERCFFKHIQDRYPSIDLVSSQTATLFDAADLPFASDDLPKTFTQFRKIIEAEPVLIRQPLQDLQHLPRPNIQEPWPELSDVIHKSKLSAFSGGSSAGLAHMKSYFSGQSPRTYKETRNALDTWEHSTKLSPWLANGNISPRQVWQSVLQYEQSMGANDSTYWIKFELLWREYFHWYAHGCGPKLFRFSGIRGQNPLTSFYSGRFKSWCAGHTEFPIVNACMNQLNSSGYISNRGRQIVASCLIHELQVDWRYGAAYFQQQLVDYDVAANWGNWQYLAGVGADPRGSRRFNLQKQTETYDPHGEFITRWNGSSSITIKDHVDAADWPIMPPQT